MGRLNWLLPGALALLGVSFLVLAVPGYDQAKALLDMTAPDGDADRFTPALHGTLRGLVLAIAGLCFVAAALLRFATARLQPGALAQPWLRIRDDARVFWQATPLTHRVALVVLLLLGAVLRALSLDLPMHSDESWTYLNYASRNLLHIASQYTSPNNHVLHNLLASASMSLFGDTPVTLRLPSYLAGVVTPPLAYWLFYRLGNRHTALLAMTMVAVWPMLVDYAANARGYSMIVALTLALLIAADAIRSKGHFVACAAFALLSALGLWVIPSFVLSIFTAGMWLVFMDRLDRGGIETTALYGRLVATGIAAVLLTLLLYSPIIASSGIASLLGNPVVTGTGVEIQTIEGRIAAVWTDWHQGIGIVVQILLALGVLLVLRQRPLRALWAAWLVGAVVLSVFQGTVGPSRIWVFALPLLLGSAAHGLITALPETTQARAAALASLLLGAFMTLQYVLDDDRSLYTEFGEYADAAAVVAALDERLAPGDGLATMFPANRTTNYYGRRAGLMPRMSAARSELRQGAPERAWVVVLPRADVSTTLSWNDQIAGTDLANSAYTVEERLSVGTSELALIRFEQR